MEGNYSRQLCSLELRDRFKGRFNRKLQRVNGLMLVNAVLMGIVVGTGVSNPRARRNPLLRYLLLGASTLFLPIVSDVAATVASDMYITGYLFDGHVVSAACKQGNHLILVLVWTAVVVTIVISTSTVVAGDAREGRSVEPPIELFIKAIWVVYLIIITESMRGFDIPDFLSFATLSRVGSDYERLREQWTGIFVPLMALPCLKMLQRYIGFYFNEGSFMLGRNPRLIVSYMAHLRAGRPSNTAHAQINDEHNTPELVVSGEACCYKLIEQPHGYSLEERVSNLGGRTRKDQMVTLRRVWDQNPDDTFLKLEHKDLCSSFALFKLLRCRFAKYSVSEAGFMESQIFFCREYLNDTSHKRAFNVIADELSFINSYYNSSVSVCHFNSAFPHIAISLMSIGYCLYMFELIGKLLLFGSSDLQVYCFVWCPSQNTTTQRGDVFGDRVIVFGKITYDVVPVYLVLVVLLYYEAKGIVYGICCNWTKVALICRYVKHTSWYGQHSAVQKFVGFVVNHCNLMNSSSWGYKMGQCSILVHRPWWKVCPRLWPYFGFPTEMPIKKEEELNAVKESVFKAIQKGDLTVGQDGTVKPIHRPSPPVLVACTANDGASVADTLLAWHIATSIFDLMGQEQAGSDSSKENDLSQQSADPDRIPENPAPLWDPNDKIAATHLSRYCAYLVACRPELLPDDDDWCKKLYEDVMKDADRLLRAAGRAGVQRLVELLNEESEYSSVLKIGMTLAQQLVEAKKGWKELADFWSQMILYIAPSENLDAHAEAISRGNELVTLLWALLAHAGIFSRPDEASQDNAAGDP